MYAVILADSEVKAIYHLSHINKSWYGIKIKKSSFKSDENIHKKQDGSY